MSRGGQLVKEFYIFSDESRRNFLIIWCLAHCGQHFHIPRQAAKGCAIFSDPMVLKRQSLGF